MCLYGHIDVKNQPPIVHEATAATPGRPPGPKSESVKPRCPANSSPGVSVAGPTGSTVAHVHHQIAVRRKITPFFVNPSVEPCTCLKRVGVHTPPYQVIPLAWTAPQNQRSRRVTSRDYEQPTRKRWLRHSEWQLHRVNDMQFVLRQAIVDTNYHRSSTNGTYTSTCLRGNLPYCVHAGVRHSRHGNTCP